MRELRRSPVWGAVLALVLGLTLAGCGGGATTYDAADPTSGDLESLVLVADPLDGSLNSTKGSTPPDPEDRIEELAEVLGLTDEQTVALGGAYLDFHDDHDALREQVRSGALSHQDARAAAEELREAFEAALQVILTADQYDQLQEMRQERHEAHRGHRNPVDRWEDWLAEVGADESEVDVILIALEGLRADMHDLHVQVHDGDLTPEEAAELAVDLRDDFDALLEATLTEAQYAALLELRPDCPQGDSDQPAQHEPPHHQPPQQQPPQQQPAGSEQ